MSIDYKNIRKIAKLMKKEHILSLKTPELEISFSDKILFHVEPRKRKNNKDEKEPSAEDLKPQYTDMEALMWSAQGYVPPSDEGIQ